MKLGLMKEFKNLRGKEKDQCKISQKLSCILVEKIYVVEVDFRKCFIFVLKVEKLEKNKNVLEIWRDM